MQNWITKPSNAATALSDIIDIGRFTAKKVGNATNTLSNLTMPLTCLLVSLKLAAIPMTSGQDIRSLAKVATPSFTDLAQNLRSLWCAFSTTAWMWSSILKRYSARNSGKLGAQRVIFPTAGACYYKLPASTSLCPNSANGRHSTYPERSGIRVCMQLWYFMYIFNTKPFLRFA